METSLYLECSAGISGDMVVAALLDAGASEEKLLHVIESLNVPGFQVCISRVKKAGLDACDFDVALDKAHDGHDHDMAYLYGHEYPADEHWRTHENEQEHIHRHECFAREHARASQCHEHEDKHMHHKHRGMAEVCDIIDASCATDGAKALAKRVFGVLAEAEAKAHATSIDEVHFHEVGAIDSIVDVLSAAVCLDDLAIENVIVPKLCEGQGMVRCQHGVIPVPVPAVVNIAAAHDIALSILDVQGELVTPTGAAIVAAVRTGAKLPTAFTVKRVGLGAGKRVYPELSGILRAFIIEPAAE